MNLYFTKFNRMFILKVLKDALKELENGQEEAKCSIRRSPERAAHRD
jgi:hypothetical protein